MSRTDKPGCWQEAAREDLMHGLLLFWAQAYFSINVEHVTMIRGE
ncbi:MAG: hypothetical protein ACK5VG_08980 [Burkholderiales bacterium]